MAEPQFNDLIAPLNHLALPLIKAGLGGPCLVPIGLVVVEVPGRRSGIVREVPLIALRYQEYLVVGTLRGPSQWLLNLTGQASALTGVNVWVNGVRRLAAVKDLSAGPPEAMHRRIAVVIERLFGASYRFCVLELDARQANRSVGETSTPLASA